MTFSFLQLPGEIRNNVYGHLLQRVYLKPVHGTQPGDLNARALFWHTFHKTHPLAFTCRQVQSEILHLIVIKGFLIFTVQPTDFVINPVSPYDDPNSYHMVQPFRNPTYWTKYVPIDRAKRTDKRRCMTFEHINKFLASITFGPEFKNLLLSKPLIIEYRPVNGVDSDKVDMKRHYLYQLEVLEFVPSIRWWRFIIKSRLATIRGPRPILWPFLKTRDDSDRNNSAQLQENEWSTLRREYICLRYSLSFTDELDGWIVAKTEVQERGTRMVRRIGWEWRANDDGEELMWVINIERGQDSEDFTWMINPDRWVEGGEIQYDEKVQEDEKKGEGEEGGEGEDDDEEEETDEEADGEDGEEETGEEEKGGDIFDTDEEQTPPILKVHGCVTKSPDVDGHRKMTGRFSV